MVSSFALVLVTCTTSAIAAEVGGLANVANGIMMDTNIDKKPGNLWDAPTIASWEEAFIAKLGQMAKTYRLEAWYDIFNGPHYFFPHEAPLWHLQLPMKLVYPSQDKYGASDAAWQEHVRMVGERNVGGMVRTERVRMAEVSQFLKDSPGHMVGTTNIASVYGIVNPRQHLFFEHGVDEDSIYFGNRDPPIGIPMNFVKYMKANQYANGPITKKQLTGIANFTNPNKPLLVYLATIDDFYGPEDGPLGTFRPASVIMSQKEKGADYELIIDLKELTALSNEYNVVLRLHPSILGKTFAAGVIQSLRSIVSESFFLDAEADGSKRLEFTDWLKPADVVVVELSASSTAALVLAIDKPIVFVRRTENDDKLISRAWKLMGDEAVQACRPQKGEKINDAMKKAISNMASSNRNTTIEARKRYNTVLYGVPLTGYEEYTVMLENLYKLDFGSLPGVGPWSDDLHELCRLAWNAGVSTKRCASSVLALRPNYALYIVNSLIILGILVAGVLYCYKKQHEPAVGTSGFFEASRPSTSSTTELMETGATETEAASAST